MRSKRSLLWLMVMIVVVVVTYGVEGSVTNEEQKNIEEVLHRNLAATEEEDIPGILQTLHPDSEAHQDEAIVDDLEYLFAVYDLNYCLEILEMNADGGDVLVTYKQITWADDDPDFMDNVLTGVHTMRKHEGEWKLLDSEILTTEPYFGEQDG